MLRVAHHGEHRSGQEDVIHPLCKLAMQGGKDIVHESVGYSYDKGLGEIVGVYGV